MFGASRGDLCSETGDGDVVALFVTRRVCSRLLLSVKRHAEGNRKAGRILARR